MDIRRRGPTWGTLVFLGLLGAVWALERCERERPTRTPTRPSPADADIAGPGADPNADIVRAWRARAHEVWVEGRAPVVKVLRDDLDPPRHQRWLVRITPELTVKISHNIDLAPRVVGVRAGDVLAFRGKYVFNDLDGAIHYTHDAPRGGPGGWIRFRGRVHR